MILLLAALALPNWPTLMGLGSADVPTRWAAHRSLEGRFPWTVPAVTFGLYSRDRETHYRCRMIAYRWQTPRGRAADLLRGRGRYAGVPCPAEEALFWSADPDRMDYLERVAVEEGLMPFEGVPLWRANGHGYTRSECVEGFVNDCRAFASRK